MGCRQTTVRYLQVTHSTHVRDDAFAFFNGSGGKTEIAQLVIVLSAFVCGCRADSPGADDQRTQVVSPS
jgi:hypothetical protein